MINLYEGMYSCIWNYNSRSGKTDMKDSPKVTAHKMADDARVAANAAYDDAKVASSNILKVTGEKADEVSDDIKIGIHKAVSDAKIAIHKAESKLKTKKEVNDDN